VKLPVLDAKGKELRKLDVDDSVFGIEPNDSVLHQAYVTHRNNQRSGSANTKTRAEVRGSTAKIRKQKYTGRARQGSARSGTRVGGGVIFGPKQRSYSQTLPKKMKRLAIRSALSGKVADGQLKIIDQMDFEAPKTKELLATLQAVGIERSALVVTGEPNRAVLISARNLERTKVLPANYLNVADMLNHAGVLMTEDAVRMAESLWAVEAAPKKKKTSPPAKPKRAAAKKAEAPAKEPEAKVEAEAVEAVEPEAKARAEVAPEKKKPAPRKRTASKKAESKAETDAEEKPKARRTTRKKAEPKAETGTEEKPKARRTTRKKKDETAEEKPKPRARRPKKTDEAEG
jgi:large subunit ribosomal protein L4